ncbi:MULTISPECIES: phage tail protein [Actinokineospora]|uniref:Phage tail protein n=1 Tax=Actinokineospora fastidiosa TaxID=1816 RepID=A0A918GI63_9PSEU|nr:MULTISPECIES: phage tail protein [Actinokineospora]UVS80839.1 T4-like virus tail tube protein gp19 [Actinokineospora sp. UTMC 2448]GGS37571.1 hypothetical protein GCM10010171_35580 [Actinokineospora fastidiosa]
MPLSDSSKIGMANRFVVRMSGKKVYDLGSWTKADGLDVAFDVAEYRAGDQGNNRFYFPGNTKYTNVKLSRAVSDETKQVREWLDKNQFNCEVFDGVIELYTALHADPVTTWDLREVMPARWAISSFDAGASQISVETLELVHSGFLPDERMLF